MVREMVFKLLLLAVTFGVIATLVGGCGSGSAPSTPKAPATNPAPVPAPTQADVAALAARGQEVYQTTAGCRNCHGSDARGVAGVAPDVRGKTVSDIKRGLSSGAMSFIRMTEADIEAVAAYLKTVQ